MMPANRGVPAGHATPPGACFAGAGSDWRHRPIFYQDEKSNVTWVRDEDVGLTYRTYDLLNRMTWVKNPFGEVTYYS